MSGKTVKAVRWQPELEGEWQAKLTSTDRDLIKTFKTLLKIDGKHQFSSDDFRMYGLDRFLRGDTLHSIGGFFCKLLRNKLAVEVGRTRSKLPSNRQREIRVYEWVDSSEVEVTQLLAGTPKRKKYEKTGQPFRGKPRVKQK